MLTSTIIIDTGPLVALTDEKDQQHLWAWRASQQLKAPLLTCDAVLSETWFLLRHLPKAQAKLLALLKQELIHSRFDSLAETDNLIELLQKYADLPMSFADACLVRMCELHPDSLIFTLDSDFTIYRRRRTEPIPQISPTTPTH